MPAGPRRATGRVADPRPEGAAARPVQRGARPDRAEREGTSPESIGALKHTRTRTAEAPMTRPGKRTWIVLAVVLLAGAAAAVFLDPEQRLLGVLRGEPFFRGRPAGYWRGQLLDANPAARDAARQALQDGGAEAVPVLVRL